MANIFNIIVMNMHDILGYRHFNLLRKYNSRTTATSSIFCQQFAITHMYTIEQLLRYLTYRTAILK